MIGQRGVYMYTVYVEYILLDNILMNYLILFAAGKALKMNPRTWRLFLSAAIGAIYSLFELMLYPSLLDFLPVKLILSVVMILTAFHFYTIKEFFKDLIAFYIMTFVFGGAMFAVGYIFGGNFSYIGGINYYGGVPIRLLLVGIVLVLVLFRLYKQFNVYFKSKDNRYKLQIFIGDKYGIFDALLDTGNQLVEPISKTPVIVCDSKKLKRIVGDEVLQFAKDMEQNSKMDITKDNMRILPYQTIEGGNKVMLGIRPKCVVIEKDNNKKVIEDVYIGINTTGVLLKGAGVLLNPQLIYDI